MKELLKPDKLYFVAAMVTSATLGYYFRRQCPPERIAPEKRHVLSFCGGLFLVCLCFGFQIVHLFVPMTFVYSSIILVKDKRLAFIISCVFCMIYLTACHFRRMYYDYGGYELDITGPLMVLIQRLTMLAANIDDGTHLEKIKRKTDKPFNPPQALATSTPLSGKVVPNSTNSPEGLFSENQKRYAVHKLPTVLEFCSYCINFQTVIIGPLIPYRNYESYIRGAEYENLSLEKEKDHFKRNRQDVLAAKDVILANAKQTLMYGVMYILISGYFPVTYYLTDEFLEFPLMKRFIYLWITCSFMRQHYYFGWSVSALCCLMSGLGFSGFDADLRPKYTLVKNFRFRSVEFAGSVKELIDNWNTSTLNWLRLVIFDRCPRKWSTQLVFTTSCIWHGFYPGYYMFFLSMGYFSFLGRQFRRVVRPRLFAKLLRRPAPEHPAGQNWLERTSVFSNVIMPTLGFPVNTSSAAEESTKQADVTLISQRYDFFTWFVTYTTVNYSALAFVLLAFQDSLVAWARLFFIPHLVGLAFHLMLINHKLVR